jgi:hypothetical protein
MDPNAGDPSISTSNNFLTDTHCSTPAISIKFQFYDDIRRVSVSESVTVSELTEQVVKKYSLPSTCQLTMHYHDGEDLCVVADDEELKEAFRVARESRVCLKFVVTQLLPGCHRNPLLQPWHCGLHARPNAPQWIDFDLGSVKSISNITMVVEQSPPGVTCHSIKADLTPAPLQVLATLQGHTSNGQVIHATWPAISARYVRVETTASPSWVAWRSIVIS